MDRALRRAHLGLGDAHYGRRLSKRSDEPVGQPSIFPTRIGGVGLAAIPRFSDSSRERVQA